MNQTLALVVGIALLSMLLTAVIMIQVRAYGMRDVLMAWGFSLSLSAICVAAVMLIGYGVMGEIQ